MKKLLVALLAAAPALALAAGTSTWNIDPAHSSTGFSVRHLVISTVRGEFGKTSGKVVLDEADVTRSTVEASIDTTTLDTRVADRDAHLKGPDFFDVARFPAITFKSTKVEKAGKDALKVTGDLTLHGVTKPVVLEVTTTGAEVKGMYGETRRGYAATTKIDRRAFGLAWSKTVEAGPVVGDEVAIQLDLSLTKDQPKAAAR
jgi:polyisoprenoid-binding protein YceI